MNSEEIFLHTPIYSSSLLDNRVGYASDLENLKENLKDILRSEQTAQKIFSIRKNANLSLYQGELIASIVRDIVLGYVFLGDMTTEIEKRLKVDEQMAGEIGDQILGEIFAPVWKELEEWNIKQYSVLGTRYTGETEDLIGTPQTPRAPNTNYLAPQNPPQAGIATGASFRESAKRDIIKAGYNPKNQRLRPFVTGAAQAKLASTQRQQSKEPSVIRPQSSRKILDLRKKT